MRTLLAFVLLLSQVMAQGRVAEPQAPRPHVAVRAVYGGIPATLMEGGRPLAESGINAVCIGSGALTADSIRRLRSQNAGVYAEFNSMHFEPYVREHPDVRPVAADGRPSPPPDGWQGVCPTHPGYRTNRMESFRRMLREFPIDGVWLDYHHSQANWEREDPVLPDTCFCDRCLERFQVETGEQLPEGDTPTRAAILLGRMADRWMRWRCDVYTDWVREYRSVLDETRPGTLLGTFHCPWSDRDLDGARIRKLAIDLKAQARYLDVFSPMPYHARFGHVDDIAWISSQVAWLGRYLGIEGRPAERLRIWPIVQLSDWGQAVPVSHVAPVLEHATRPPATGVMVFAWGSLQKQPDKVGELIRVLRNMVQ